MRRLIAGACLVAVAATVAAGCGGGEPAADLTGTGDLQLLYVPEPGVKARAATLSCPATKPDERAACEQLESLEDPFAPVPPDAACTFIFGGPEQITAYGTWEGQKVDTKFVRTNGCEIDRYAAVAPVLLPLLGGPGGG